MYNFLKWVNHFDIYIYLIWLARRLNCFIQNFQVASITSNQRVSSSVPSPSSYCKYDVFLSFRGEDSRTHFACHLHNALTKKGIKIFDDDKELERGKAISPGLFKAIEESRFSVVIFLRYYSYSTWSLDELAMIVYSKNTSSAQMVFPILFEVEPTVVRKQTGSFHEAFAKHEEAFRENIKKVQNLRHALTEVANPSGWHLKDR